MLSSAIAMVTGKDEKDITEQDVRGAQKTADKVMRLFSHRFSADVPEPAMPKSPGIK